MDTKESRRKWTKEETLALLDAYGSRADDFKHPARKKHAMNAVLEDLVSRGALMQPTSVDMLHAKIKNLLRAYKSSKDNATQTGAARIVVPFEEQLEELFGSRPVMANNHCLALSGEPIAAIGVAPSGDVEWSTQSAPEAQSPNEDEGASSQFLFVSSPTPQKKRARMTKDKYFEKKLKIMADFAEMKKVQHKEKEEGKQNRHAEKMNLLKSLCDKVNK